MLLSNSGRSWIEANTVCYRFGSVNICACTVQVHVCSLHTCIQVHVPWQTVWTLSSWETIPSVEELKPPLWLCVHAWCIMAEIPWTTSLSWTGWRQTQNRHDKASHQLLHWTVNTHNIQHYYRVHAHCIIKLFLAKNHNKLFIYIKVVKLIYAWIIRYTLYNVKELCIWNT